VKRDVREWGDWGGVAASRGRAGMRCSRGRSCCGTCWPIFAWASPLTARISRPRCSSPWGFERLLHEPPLHLPALQGQPLRLSDHPAATRGRTARGSRELDAPEPSGNPRGDRPARPPRPPTASTRPRKATRAAATHPDRKHTANSSGLAVVARQSRQCPLRKHTAYSSGLAARSGNSTRRSAR